MRQKSFYKVVNIENGNEDYGDYTLVMAHEKANENFDLRPLLRIVPENFVKIFVDGGYRWGAPDDE